MEFNDEYADNDSEEYDLSAYTLPPEAEMSQYGMVLQILGPGGDVEEIMFDIEEIYNYVRNVYKNCPERN